MGLCSTVLWVALYKEVTATMYETDLRLVVGSKCTTHI